MTTRNGWEYKTPLKVCLRFFLFLLSLLTQRNRNDRLQVYIGFRRNVCSVRTLLKGNRGGVGSCVEAWYRKFTVMIRRYKHIRS